MTFYYRGATSRLQYSYAETGCPGVSRDSGRWPLLLKGGVLHVLLGLPAANVVSFRLVIPKAFQLRDKSGHNCKFVHFHWCLSK